MLSKLENHFQIMNWYVKYKLKMDLTWVKTIEILMVVKFCCINCTNFSWQASKISNFILQIGTWQITAQKKFQPLVNIQIINLLQVNNLNQLYATNKIPFNIMILVFQHLSNVIFLIGSLLCQIRHVSLYPKLGFSKERNKWSGNHSKFWHFLFG